MLQYDNNDPILFLIFNRLDTTSKVFEEIRKAKPKKLYIAADGARNTEELIKCNKVRKVATDVDWDCEIKTLFREKNLGCGRAVSEGIKWFFEQEEKGIVLEDDCLPDISFFGFCSELLKFYEYDERIGHICGSNFQNGQIRGEASYYFSGLTHVWGWASWRRVWKDYDFNLKTLPNFNPKLEAFPAHQPFAATWFRNFSNVALGHIDTWDYQYAYLNLIKGYKAIMPNINLISNIGVGADATHTLDEHPFAALSLGHLKEINHPELLIQNVEADMYTQIKEYYIVPRKNFLSRLWKSIKTKIR